MKKNYVGGGGGSESKQWNPYFCPIRLVRGIANYLKFIKYVPRSILCSRFVLYDYICKRVLGPYKLYLTYSATHKTRYTTR